MRYRTIQSEVSATEIKKLITINGATGDVGDYIVDDMNGNIKIMTKAAFELEFEPGSVDFDAEEREMIDVLNARLAGVFDGIKKDRDAVIRELRLIQRDVSSLVRDVRPLQAIGIKPILTEPTPEEIARIKAENEQEDLLACFTCHRDVKATEVDEEKNCPQCSTAPKGTSGKKTGIGVCEECGTPSFYEEMKEGVCKACQGVV